jgi:hypothetical protein
MHFEHQQKTILHVLAVFDVMTNRKIPASIENKILAVQSDASHHNDGDDP